MKKKTKTISGGHLCFVVRVALLLQLPQRLLDSPAKIFGFGGFSLETRLGVV